MKNSRWSTEKSYPLEDKPLRCSSHFFHHEDHEDHEDFIEKSIAV
jgi:hypothetical protein